MYRGIISFCIVSFVVSQISADDGVQVFFKQHCVECHGPEKQKGKLRLDTLNAPSEENKETWEVVLEVLDAGDMPPEKKPQPKPADVKAVLAKITEQVVALEPEVPAMRRMSRFEYQNTIQDLLGVDVNVAEILPEDGRVDGFDNVAGGLSISSVLMERYLEAANLAFDDVIRRIEPLPAETRRAVLMEDKSNIGSVKKKNGGVLEHGGAFIDFTPGWPPARVDQCHPIEPGFYKCRVAIFPYQPSQRTIAVAIYVGEMFGTGKRRFIGNYDATGTPEDPKIIEFDAWFNPGETIHVLARIFPEHVTWRDKHEPRPGVGILWAETHGPIDQSFPSEAQKKLFGVTDSQTMVPRENFYLRHRRGVKLHHVESSKPAEDVERIIRNFVPRAFRRPVSDAEIEPYVKLAMERLEKGRPFEQAVRAGVVAVLCSPQFLVLNRQEKVDDYEVASRLSYFLWSSMPDNRLLELAAMGKLKDSKALRAEVRRMLKDPKIDRFVTHFTNLWLDLDEIEFTTPSKKLYPEYDELLLHAMLGETRLFFRHLLDENLSVTNFLDSDFTFLNERLASHYGIEGVKGHETLRKVYLPEGSVRGGLLSHASILKVTANGTTTSPILRGVWVQDKILGRPPQAPPAGVPAVEPDIRGATSIREQLSKHRENEACARCHSKIDPPGFALEVFDPIGGHRDRYRTLGKGDKAGNQKSYRLGLSVDASGELPEGEKFNDYIGYRNFLINHREVFIEGITKRLLVYGTGRPIDRRHQESVDQIVQKSASSDYGFQTLLEEVVLSELFQKP
jgi:hypothetical protein